MDNEYFQNKFRTSSIRMNHWNYSWPAMYYVTICTQNRECCLGEIKDGQVYMTKIGNIVFEEVINVPKLRRDVLLDDFIVMPNHIHVIFVIKEDDFGHNGRDTVNRVSTDRKFGFVQPKSLSSIVNAFKGGVTRRCHKNNLDFQWQANYYEHIIKNDEDYARIKEYIAHNPVNWIKDRNNSVNIK
ncbi:MAG: transposase [Candidatus Parcubacteria bacterium]|nr:transposase [Candidatus Parcubacteria bacterium]